MSKTTYKYHSVPVPLYFGRLHIIVAHDLNAAHAAAGFLDRPKYANEDYEAFVFHATQKNAEGFFAFLRPGAKPGVVAHEALHLSHYIMDSRCIRHDYANDEPQAYLLGWLVEQMHYALTSKAVKASPTILLS